MKKILFCCIIVASYGLLSAQNQQNQHKNRKYKNRNAQHDGQHHRQYRHATDANLVGDIIDKTSGEHLPYVNLVVKGTTKGAMSDGTGHFLLTNLEEGEHTIVFSMIGYGTVEKKISAKKDSTYNIRVYLEEESTWMDDVVVSGNRYETKQKNIGTLVNLIDPIQMETVTANSIGEALDYQTGIRYEYSCQNCGAPTVRINGLDGQYSQVLMDSRPIFSSLAGVYGLEQIPTSMVDRIEVIRGGGSALFGSNAIAGVINIITKEATKNSFELGNTTTLIGGKSFDINTSLNGSFVAPNGKIGAFVFGSNRQRQAYDDNNDGYSEIPKINNTTLGFRSYFKTGLYSKITAEYHHLYEFRRGGDSLDLPPHEATIAEQTEHNNDVANLAFSTTTKDQLHFFSLYTAMQNINRKSYYGTQKDPNAYGRTTDITATAGLQYNFSWLQLAWLPAKLSAGFEYNYDQLHDVIQGYDRDLLQTVQIYGGYLQNEWSNDKLSFLIGGRIDKHNMMKNVVFSPRTNVRYTPIENVILRANYASGYRAPQAFDEDLHVGAVGGEVSLIELDPDLTPEHSHSASLSVDLYKNWNYMWNTNLTLEGFYTRINDAFMLQEKGYDANGNIILERTNADGGAFVSGLNLEGKIAYKKLFSLQLGYTYQQSQYDTEESWSDDPNVEATKTMFRSPDHYGYLTFNITPVENLDISLTGKATGSMLVEHFAGYIPEDRTETTDAFYDMGFKVCYDIPLYKDYTLELFAGMKNVLNSYQSDQDLGPDRDAGYVYGPSLPRSYFAGMKLAL